MHAENGFMKIFPAQEGSQGRKVEASYSHPFGMNEFEFGSITEKSLTLSATEEHNFQRPSPASQDADIKAKQVTGIRREYTLTDDGCLEYKIYLKVGDQDEKHHLEAKLQKVE